MAKPNHANERRRYGLRVTRRTNSQNYYIEGTLRIGGKSVRVRESTGIDVSMPGAWEAADALRLQKEMEIVDRIVYHRPPPRHFELVAADYLARRDYSNTVEKTANELARVFAGIPVASLDRDLIEGFYDKRFADLNRATRRRHEIVLHAILKLAVEQRLLNEVPFWNRVPPRYKKGGAVMKRFLPGEVELIIECAAPHVRPLIAVMYVTGARVSQTLYLKREHFILERGRGQVTFPNTKNGHSYVRPLHDYAVDQLWIWMMRRRDRHPEMFLTNHREPYYRRTDGGGCLWMGFRTPRDMAANELERRGYPERAALMRQATPHWLRHNFANTLRQVHGLDARAIAKAGMWESVDVVNRTYIGDAEESISEKITTLPFGLGIGARDEPLDWAEDPSTDAMRRRFARSQQAGFGLEETKLLAHS